tara:strand:- start:87 stop:593 length:507 start_codon:yes stop_codon:yes gene_type:complete
MALKKSSSTIAIGASVTESAANTFTESRIDLQLNPLDNEVFVVTAVNLDLVEPDALAGVNTAVNGSMSTTSLTAAGNLSQSQVLAVAKDAIRAAGFVDGGVAFSRTSMETPPADLDYIGIIATNDFFLQITGLNNAVAKAMTAKIYGYRAKADAATYAALVQSEVLSS